MEIKKLKNRDFYLSIKMSDEAKAPLIELNEEWSLLAFEIIE